LHYTKPGDIIFDGFCGTGMTGVAAQLCNHKSSIQDMGYRVQEDGAILRYEPDDYGKMSWKSFSRIGPRNTILNDLSPAATFIAHNFNYPINLFEYKIKTESILAELDKEYAWMFQTLHLDGKIKGRVNYTVWSDVFICPECTGEVVYWKGAAEVKKDKVIVKKDFPCPHCNTILSKSPLKKSSAQKLERAWITYFDKAIGKTIKQAKQVPVLINYSVGKTRFEKMPDSNDLSVIEKINNMEIPLWYPTDELPKGDKTGEPIRVGITNVHHFFTKRTLLVLSTFLDKINYSCSHQQNFLHGSVLPKLTKMNRYMPQHGSRALVGPMANTLYVPPMSVENNTIKQYRFQFKKILKALNEIGGNIISNQASESTSIPNESIDYIFLDPPFGSNIMYSELSFIREAWLKIFTNNKQEAIQNNTQGKDLNEYRHLMTVCLKDAFRILKPGRWLTVEFSNTKASVWNTIQTAIQEAGFVVASVDGLDKTRGGFHAMITPTAVKQDLVISAYKPNGGLEKRFGQTGHTEESVWLFVRNHLKHLPKVKIKGGHLEFINERDARILYDRTVAFYIRHNLPVPISSHEFRKGLVDEFPERDGMFFLSDQAAEYDKKRLQVQSLGQMQIWVEDERSAVDWLRNFLKNKPSKYQEIQPEFFEKLNEAWKKWETRPELRSLLDQYFLCYDGQENVPPQIHSYLSTNFKDLRKLPADNPLLRSKAKDRWYMPDPRKNADVEKLREKRLLEEFWTYLPPGYDVEAIKRRVQSGQETLPGMESPPPKIPKGKRLKLVRTEAVRVGFKQCYQIKDYQTIIAVAHYIPEDVVNGDDQLQMIYDSAVTRSGLEI
ncbi:DNA methylase, partial [bacterium]|nr:DNA methylase [bacterium]